MHLISFDANPRQLSKLRNGHAVRIKKGAGFNLIVHPNNYSLVSRAFGKNKGVQLKLTPEEIETNENLSPEQHEELGNEAADLFKVLPFAEGGSIWKSMKRAGRKVEKALKSKTARRLFRPIVKTAKDVGKSFMHEKLADLHMGAADEITDPRLQRLLNVSASQGHEAIHHGFGLGAGISAHHALKLANLASASANHELSKMHNASVHGYHTQPPIKNYWDDDLAPPSRGYGMHNHYNMIRGRGSMIAQDHFSPPALQSQPYGANWHMQFFLPPQYQRYNDGTDIEGSGLYI